ncbi:MAG: hypothetical protein GF315_09830, partial [candidate division Zixibacteria bacterium]|nr:hypothetical protein [candidate division Zixibacteria bacterium]
MIKKLLRLIIPLGILSLFLVSNVLAGGLALSGVGARAISMGGAFRGVADDWSACYWNPAGLATLEKSEFNGTVSIISPKPEYNPNYVLRSSDGDFEYSLGYKNGTAWYTHDENHKIPNISGFFKFPGLGDATAGIAIYIPYGTGAVWDIYDLPTGYNTLQTWEEVDHKSEISVVDFHPTFAKQLTDKVSFGVGISIQQGSVFLQQVKSTQFSTSAPYPYNFFFTNMELDGEGWGYGANVGLLVDVNEKLSVGLAYRSPTTITIEGDSELDLYTPYNQDLVDLYNSYETAADSATADLYRGYLYTAYPPAEAELKLPADYGIGFAYRATEKLTLSADFNYTDWSRFDQAKIDFMGNGPFGTPQEDATLYTEWEGTFRFSFGLEYLYSSKLAFRAGYFNDPSPIPDETFTPTIPDIGTKNSL